MGNIFISYSHKDSKYVSKLEKDLKEKGFEIWIDKQIRFGTKWSKEIQDHLDQCEAFIVVESENSLESEWVQNEVSYAHEVKKPIFPLLLTGKPWLPLRAIQHVNVKRGKLPPPEFYERLADIVSKSYEAPPPPPPKVKQAILLLLKIVAVLALLVVVTSVAFPKNSILAFQRLQTLTLDMQIMNERNTWVNPLRVMRVNATREITITIDTDGTPQVTCGGWIVRPKAVEILQEDGCRMTFYAITYQDTTVNVNVTVEGRNWEKILYFRPKR